MYKAGQTPEGRYCVEYKVGCQWKRFDGRDFGTRECVQSYIKAAFPSKPVRLSSDEIDLVIYIASELEEKPEGVLVLGMPDRVRYAIRRAGMIETKNDDNSYTVRNEGL